MTMTTMRDLFLARARASYPQNPTFALQYDQYIIQALAQRYSDPGMFDTQVGISQAVEGAWTTAFQESCGVSNPSP